MTDTTPLSSGELAAYFALKEVAGLLEHGIEQQLRDEGGISGAQFGILARLSGSPTGRLRMTDLADGLVYSRSGITYQAGQLGKQGLVSRTPAADDERSIIVEITPAGRDLFARILPGHVEVVRRLLFDALNHQDVDALSDLMTRLRDHMRTAPPRSAKPRKPARERSPRRPG